MRFSFKDILTVLKNSLIAILKAEFLFRMRVDKYFTHILYTFFLFGVIIWCSLMTENAMAKVQKNNREIEELEIARTQKIYDLSRATKRSEITLKLEKLGSDLHENGKPATRIGK